MKKFLIVAMCLAVIALPLTGCMYLKHNVGSGAAGGTQVSERQWYALWGLVPLGQVDSAKMAAGATNYTVESQHTIIDILINIVTQYVTINSQTVTVTK
jgi:hypothetical protein